jgi:arylsulfatase A-like enzyme
MTVVHVRRLATVLECLAIAATVLGAIGLTVEQPSAGRSAVVIVVDGLRPDFVTPTLMPRLVRLGERGIVFRAHHAVYPTVTRVNAATFVTGVYPEAHGLLGNTVFVPSANPLRGLDTGSRANLEAIAQAEGRLLTAPSLGEILPRAGKRVLAVGAGTSGAAFLLNHTVGTGAIVHPEFTRPPEFASHVLDRLGPPPQAAMPNAAQNRYAVDAYLKLGLEELHPDLTLMWISDPDHTAHSKGIGTEPTTRALALADAEIGRIEDTLQASGLLDRTNLIVVSDHGFSTHTGAFRLQSVVDPFVARLPDGSPDLVVAEGAVYLRGAKDAARVAAIVRALQRRPEVGAVFTKPSPRGGAEGSVAGTLSFDVVRWNHPRSGEILVSSNWTDDKNEAGYAGTTGQSGVAGHGATSPHDIHNVLIAEGPDFRRHASSDVPTGNVDLAPTVLRLLGLPAPPTMAGRVITEAFVDGPAAASLRIERSRETVRTSDGRYELTAQFSGVAGYRYLDYTEVKRRPQ